MDLAALKSGTDLRGVAIAGKDPVTLTDEAAAAAAAGFVLYLRAHTERKRLKIALGHDSRLSADRLTSAVLGVLKRAGFLTRDARAKERKKYGLRAARARYQYSKR